MNTKLIQECIPVGCIPPAHLLSGGGVCPGDVPCDLSHCAFDDTCMLS